MSMNAKVKERVLRELTVKARFLSYVGLFAIIIFFLLLIKLYPNRENSRAVFLLAFVMEAFSFVFFIIARRVIGILKTNPGEKEILKWDNLLSYYYYPKFIFRKKKNRFIVPDDQD